MSRERERESKSQQERSELHRTIWKIADELRGAVDGWDFKQYILGFLFYRYISENFLNYVNEFQQKKYPNFDYSEMSDKDAEKIRNSSIRVKGFFILPSELFCNVQKRAANDKDLNITLTRVFKNIEDSTINSESEGDFKGLFNDIDMSSNRLGSNINEKNNRIVKLLNGIAEMKLGEAKHNEIDTFGDAYEYLIKMYASNAGKSGGEFFTPQEVSELLARISIGESKKINSVYDPACGSGSLLLQPAKILGKNNVARFYGQEINPTTFNLCRMNMFLHDLNYIKFKIAHDDTLLRPDFKDKEFDVIVSNPPYSVKWEGEKYDLINDPRFEGPGVLAPASKADLAFVLHCLHYLSSNGCAAIVCFPGIFYRSGAEEKIRKYLVDNNYVDAVIQLPDNLFFGTTIATSILVIRKNKTTEDVLFVDGSRQFIKIENNNKLTQENIDFIYKSYSDRKELNHTTKIVTNSEIAKNNYNLAPNNYIKPLNEDENIDINSLNAEIDSISKNQEKLKSEIKNIIKEIENIA